jgi:hypothetical protein
MYSTVKSQELRSALQTGRSHDPSGRRKSFTRQEANKYKYMYGTYSTCPGAGRTCPVHVLYSPSSPTEAWISGRVCQGLSVLSTGSKRKPKKALPANYSRPRQFNRPEEPQSNWAWVKIHAYSGHHPRGYGRYCRSGRYGRYMQYEGTRMLPRCISPTVQSGTKSHRPGWFFTLIDQLQISTTQNITFEIIQKLKHKFLSYQIIYLWNFNFFNRLLLEI